MIMYPGKLEFWTFDSENIAWALFMARELLFNEGEVVLYMYAL